MFVNNSEQLFVGDSPLNIVFSIFKNNWNFEFFLFIVFNIIQSYNKIVSHFQDIRKLNNTSLLLIVFTGVYFKYIAKWLQQTDELAMGVHWQ